ncbi:type I restriction enzyme M protein [Algoriphagus boseongensis]|uniref:site-specific DNA-methyltransferase (adenine-specific) n=1 Tax=Algoriphagus boseongensis TaxID=1442587 RepID=A0A4R6T7B5_9BACT|nr:type I restriction-modification system subunit M [Algoriphagus boseongensis]TDQ18900.1 type I restriction enzyme M protein [Algoriphagus boseongensis]
MLQNNANLKSTINNLWNTFWSGGISNPLTAIEQITYLLFMKRLDDMEAKREKDAEFTGEPYTSRFSGTYIPHFDDTELYFDKGDHPSGRSEKEIAAIVAENKKPRDKNELRWSFFKTMAPAEKMLEHVRFNVFPFIRTLNGETSPFTKHMANAVFIIEKPLLLVEAIKQIELIFQEIEKDAIKGGHAFQDIQGDVYEMLLSEIATAGKNGQFRTPRHIIKLMSDLVEPKLGKRIADPACGTGGFLLGAYQYILSDLVRQKDPSKLVKDNDGFERGSLSAVLTEEVKQILEDSFFGYDIDITMVRLGLMNLMMHGIDNPHIDYKDTLSKTYNEDALYDIVMANPPFTGSIDKGDINENLKLQTTKTELLFVERIYNMLKMGGVAAIIVPQGVLFSSSNAFIQLRKKMVEEAELNAVITMPSGVFKPYAGVSTSILIFTKGGVTENTWFYEMKDDGYELNDRRAEKFKEGGARDFGDLQDIITKYRSRNPEKDNDRTAQCFFVPKKEIEDNNYDLSMSKYQEQIFEEIEYKDPALILEELEKLEETIQAELKTLKDMIA